MSRAAAVFAACSPLRSQLGSPARHAMYRISRQERFCCASSVHQVEQPAVQCLPPFLPSAIERGRLRRGHVSLISLGSKPISHLCHDASCVFFFFRSCIVEVSALVSPRLPCGSVRLCINSAFSLS